jgi:putative DNA primase/helicase
MNTTTLSFDDMDQFDEGMLPHKQVPIDELMTAIKATPDNDEGHLQLSTNYSMLIKSIIVVAGQAYHYDKKGWRMVDNTMLLALLTQTLPGATSAWLADIGVFGGNCPPKLLKELEKRVVRAGNISNVKGLKDRIMGDSELQRQLSQMDANHDMLGLANGDVVNLKSGEVIKRIAAKNHLVTRACLVDKLGDANQAMQFKQFIVDITANADGTPDPEMANYILLIMAYAIIGRRSEQLWFLFHGSGSNGKSLLLWVLSELMGSYATSVNPELLGQHPKNPEAPTPALIALRDHRLSIVGEVPKGIAVDESIIKAVTGEDKIRARGLHQSGEAVAAKSLLIWGGNYMPTVKGNDHGFWRRVVVVPFRRTFESDSGAKDRLVAAFKSEMPHILALLVAHAHLWYGGATLKVQPSSVVSATTTYRKNGDSWGQFMDEMVTTIPNSSEGVTVSELCHAYKGWLEGQSAGYESRVISCNKTFPQMLEERGIKTVKRANGKIVVGVFLTASLKDSGTTIPPFLLEQQRNDLLAKLAELEQQLAKAP